MNARAKRRRENDMMPVKLCERREKKEKASIRNVVLESLESKFFNIKYNEKKKKMKPKLLGTEIAPK